MGVEKCYYDYDITQVDGYALAMIQQEMKKESSA